jgi:hypothetical protein
MVIHCDYIISHPIMYLAELFWPLLIVYGV